jgi:C-terminal processing protease CtpA/Prc
LPHADNATASPPITRGSGSNLVWFRLRRLLGSAILAGATAAATEGPDAADGHGPAAVSDTRAAVDQLDQAALQETFHVLRQNYVQRDLLTLTELNRAALEGLLLRLSFGAEIVPVASPESDAAHAQPFSLLSDVVSEGIGYLRPAAFSPEELTTAEGALKKLIEQQARALILDLRCPAGHGEFSVAAGWLDFFFGPDEPLFSVQKPGGVQAQSFRSKAPVLWKERLVLHIDEESANVAVTIAAVLIEKRKPLVFGSATRGRTMEYHETPISPTHKLRFASSEMVLPDGRSVFRKGLEPSVPVAANRDAKRRIFSSSQTEGMRNFIVDVERPRVNERALVNRTSPELAYHIARGAGRKSEFDEPPLQDRVVQQALDTLVAGDFLKSGP